MWRFFFFFVVSKIIFGSYEVTPSSLASFALHIVHHYLAVWKTLPGHDIWVSQWEKKKVKSSRVFFSRRRCFITCCFDFDRQRFRAKQKRKTASIGIEKHFAEADQFQPVNTFSLLYSRLLKTSVHYSLCFCFFSCEIPISDQHQIFALHGRPQSRLEISALWY